MPFVTGSSVSEVAEIFRDPFDNVFVVANRDQGDAGDLAQPSLQVFVVCPNKVTSVAFNAIDDAVISIGALMAA